MSDITEPAVEKVFADLARSDRDAYLEQRIFVLSPFNTFVTAALLFVLAAGSYALAALANGLPIIVDHGGGPVLEDNARIAFTLSLLITVVLGMQRFILKRTRTEMIRAACVFRGGLTTVAGMSELTPHGARLGAATLLGLLPGSIIVWLMLAQNGIADFARAPAVSLWFTTITLLLAMSFTRGVELTRRGSQSSVASINSELIIDLLRIDRLSFLGRSAARFSLIWFSVAAVSCLFFVGNGITGFTIALLAIFAVIGGWSFVGLMEGVHRRIVDTKRKELERVRSAIDEVSITAHLQADAAQRLQGLLAYEARIMAAPEWPFDQTTLMRVGASALILTVPWFGQAIVAYLIEHLGTR